MSTLLKALIGLCVALPLAAFVAGSLVMPSDDSPPRQRIIVRDDSLPAGGEDRTEVPREQDAGREPLADDSDDDGPDDDGGRAPGGGGIDDDDERDDDSNTGGPGGADDDDDSRDDGADDDTGEDAD